MEPSPGFCGLKRKAEDVEEPAWDSKDFGLKKKGLGMFRCDLCNVECNSKALLEGHFNGKKHKAKESAKEEFEDCEKFYCDICDLWCTSDIMLNAHLRGKKHKVNKAKKDGNGDYPRGKDEEKAQLWCEICEVGCNSEAVMATHLNGKKHKAKEAKFRMHKEDEAEVCDEIEESCSDPQGHLSNDEKKEEILDVGCDKNEECSDPQGQGSSKEKKDEIFDVGCDKNEEGSDPQGQMNNEEKKEELVDVGCQKDGEGNDPQGQTDAKENGNCKDLNCNEPKEFWCLICRVKCDSQAMISKHLKGMEHKATKAMRWGKND